MVQKNSIRDRGRSGIRIRELCTIYISCRELVDWAFRHSGERFPRPVEAYLRETRLKLIRYTRRPKAVRRCS